MASCCFVRCFSATVFQEVAFTHTQASISSVDWRAYILQKQASREAYVDHFKESFDNAAHSRPSTSTGFSVASTVPLSRRPSDASEPGTAVSRPRDSEETSRPTLSFMSRTEFSTANPLEDDDYRGVLDQMAVRDGDINDDMNKAVGFEAFEQRARNNYSRRQNSVNMQRAWDNDHFRGAAAGGYGNGLNQNDALQYRARAYGGMLVGSAMSYRERPSTLPLAVSADAVDSKLSKSKAFRTTGTPVGAAANPLTMKQTDVGKKTSSPMGGFLKNIRHPGARRQDSKSGTKRVRFQKT